MLCATPPSVWVMTAGFEVWGSGSVWLVEAVNGA